MMTFMKTQERDILLSVRYKKYSEIESKTVFSHNSLENMCQSHKKHFGGNIPSQSSLSIQNKTTNET